MQNKIVIDSCVFNKIFLKEPDTQQALDLITALTEKNFDVLAIAQLNDYPAAKANALITGFQETQFKLIKPDIVCVEKAFEICNTGHIKSGFPSFYDAIYHALAILNNCYFVTADKRHFSKTSQLGNIVLLKDWENILTHNS
jgi:predicted nucleic acid-binding protein